MNDQQTHDHRPGLPQPFTGADVPSVDAGDT